MKKSYLFILKFLISFSIIGYLFYKTDIQLIVDNINGLSLSTLAIGLLFFYLALAVGALRWRLLLPEYSFLVLLRFTIIGYFYSLVLPGQVAGDIVKTVLFGKGRKNKEKVVASVILQRLSGFMGLLLVGCAGLLFSQAANAKALLLFYSALTTVIIFSFAIIRLEAVYNFFLKFLSKLGSYHQRLQALAGKIEKLLTAWRLYINQPSLILLAVLLGMVFQLLCLGFILMLAGDVNLNLPFYEWCWIFGLSSIAVMIPVSIGGLGLREGTMVGFITALGESGEAALTLSLLIYLLTLLGSLPGGILSFQKEKARPNL